MQWSRVRLATVSTTIHYREDSGIKKDTPVITGNIQ